MGIMPPGTDSDIDPTLPGVAALMVTEGDAFTSEVGALLASIADDHDDPRWCSSCNAIGTTCATYDRAVYTAFAWLLSRAKTGDT